MKKYQVGIDYIIDVEADNPEEATDKVLLSFNRREIVLSNKIPIIGDYCEEIEDES